MKTELPTDQVAKECEPVDLLDVVVAAVWPLIAITVFCMVNTSLMHWFILPLYLCGVLMGVDAIRWLRGKMDTYDAKGIVGMLGCHFFVIAPLLVAHFPAGNIGRIYIDDWRPWLGYMAIFNAAGLVLYQLGHRWGYKKPARAVRTYWALDSGRATIAIPVILVFVLFAHAFFMIRLGGLSSFINVITYGFGEVYVTGLGPFMVLGRSIPLVVFVGLTIWRYRKLQRSSSVFVVGFILILFLIIQFLTAGLTGSRSATIWGLFWAVGIVHFFWRRIPVRWVMIGMVPLLAFMFLYGFYKSLGRRAFERGVTLESLVAETGGTFAGMLVGDLSRADVQAAQFYVATTKPWYYRYRFGSTYPTSVVPLIPRKLWPGKPDDSGKVIAGTEMIYGPGTYYSKRTTLSYWRATKIYGLAGEAMLNFGVAGIIPVFGIWGYIVGRIRRRVLSYRFGDVRLLAAPYLVNLCFMLLVHDMSNVAAVTLYKWVIPALIVYLVAARLPASEIEAESADSIQAPAMA